jgi:hypothetical protein
VELRQQEQMPVIRFTNDGELMMNMRHQQFSFHDNAVGQLAERMDIPSQYLLALAHGNEWQRHLVVVADAKMTDTKIWAETILPMPITIPTLKNGDVVIFMGARFSTSDYGDGAVDMRAFLLNGACLNGMVRESVMKQIHLGARLPDNLQLSNKTYELDTQTTVSATRDLTKSLFSRDAIIQKAIEIQGASNIDVDFDSELKKLVKVGSLHKSESESVQKILMRNHPDDGTQGNSTLWKLTQAITAHARDTDDHRSRELHELSGMLINRVKIPV